MMSCYAWSVWQAIAVPYKRTTYTRVCTHRKSLLIFVIYSYKHVHEVYVVCMLHADIRNKEQRAMEKSGQNEQLYIKCIHMIVVCINGRNRVSNCGERKRKSVNQRNEGKKNYDVARCHHTQI